jgi:hypothetical protein
MVGIYRKIVQLAELLQKYSPILDTFFVPGLGSLVGTVGGIGENMADGVNNVYEDRKIAKQKGKKYGIGDGVESLFKSQLKKLYGELYP